MQENIKITKEETLSMFKLVCNQINRMEKVKQKLKILDLFDDFKVAMEIIENEVIKLKSEWDIKALNSRGLSYNPKLGSIYLEEDSYLHHASNNKWSSMGGISFGIIKWEFESRLKSRDNFFTDEDYNKYQDKAESIDFSVFYGLTPSEILYYIQRKL